MKLDLSVRRSREIRTDPRADIELLYFIMPGATRSDLCVDISRIASLLLHVWDTRFDSEPLPLGT